MVNSVAMRQQNLSGHRGQAIGIMGGSFDPIHYGHLLVAEVAREQYNLAQVVFVPNLLSPLKNQEQVSPGEERYKMVEVAIADNPYFVVSRQELDRPGPSYSIDTIRAFRTQLDPTACLFFITGADAILELLDWREPEAILADCQIVAAYRPGFNLHMLASVLGEERAGKIDMLPMRGVDISSSEIRQRVHQGQSIRYLTPPAVVDYVGEQGLYLADSSAGDEEVERA